MIIIIFIYKMPW